MDQPDQTALAAALLAAPGWARVGLTARHPRLRARAAEALATTIVEHLAPSQAADPRQIALPL